MAFEARWYLMAGAPVGTWVGSTGMFSPLTVLARVAIRAGAAVLVRLGVDARAPIDAGVVAATVIQVFVTQQATPVGLTVTMPGFYAAAVHTAGIRDTLVAKPPLPAIAAPALTRHSATPMEQVTALSAHSILALLAHPAIQAGLVAILVTGVVTEEVITGPAELVACGAVVVLVAAHTDLQL